MTLIFQTRPAGTAVATWHLWVFESIWKSSSHIRKHYYDLEPALQKRRKISAYQSDSIGWQKPRAYSISTISQVIECTVGIQRFKNSNLSDLPTEFLGDFIITDLLVKFLLKDIDAVDDRTELMEYYEEKPSFITTVWQYMCWLRYKYCIRKKEFDVASAGHERAEQRLHWKELRSNNHLLKL